MAAVRAGEEERKGGVLSAAWRGGRGSGGVTILSIPRGRDGASGPAVVGVGTDEQGSTRGGNRRTNL
jgi:hypothetical protein